MKTLRMGDRGPSVALLQLALSRAGYDPGALDGVFGARVRRALTAFQRGAGLVSDGVAGPETRRALTPYFTGYESYTVRAGDTIYRIAISRGSTVRAIETANPGLDPLDLRPGRGLVVPLSAFPVTPTNIPYSSGLLSYVTRGLAARYPFLAAGEIGRSVMGAPLHLLRFGEGENRVIYSAAHHANEWITSPVLLKFAEELAEAYVHGGSLYGVSAEEIWRRATVYIIPAIDPDGIDLVTGELTSGEYYESAAAIGRNYPDIPFPSGWKANIRGVDLNLQYPAGWDSAREIKFAQGYTRPAPRDFVGSAPLCAPESRALYDFTRDILPSLVLAYHTQGEIIYWKYLDMEPPGAREIGESFAAASGYALEDTPYASGFAGYKDWFIQDYGRPGYTVECGLGENPLPISAFDAIFERNLGILALGTLATARPSG